MSHDLAHRTEIDEWAARFFARCGPSAFRNAQRLREHSQPRKRGDFASPVLAQELDRELDGSRDFDVVFRLGRDELTLPSMHLRPLRRIAREYVV